MPCSAPDHGDRLPADRLPVRAWVRADRQEDLIGSQEELDEVGPQELTTLATKFCPAEFAIGDLRSVYEVVWGEPLDPRNFSRKVINTQGFVEPTDSKRVPATGRPAALYRAGPATTLNPPIMRTGSH